METPNTNESKSPRVIKRYANRKLYDTRDSRYVTLLQIAEYVRGGEDVTIIDNTTKEDLTNATLAQIVYEAEKNSAEKPGETGRPKTMGTLRSLIQNGGELFQTSSERLMSSLREGPMGKLIARREGTEPEKVEAKPEKVEAKAEAIDEPTKAERKNLLLDPKGAIDELQRLADERVRVVLGTAIQSMHQLQGEVMRLHDRIEELEQKLVDVQKRRSGGGEGDGDEGTATTPRETERKPSERS
ncbi:MAG: polyhydroxyalkanoate synthesis regulator DNA-binding domain-containing protein [Deltaproteobacteria bacterium]|nr:polyhydroxyalkanoate synthesis regulator DNA-binding domain-containing protein [Deltaproteobacteria bacterium]